MMHHTEVAVLAILRADPTVDAETIRAAVAVLKGRAPAPAADAEPVDRAIPRSRVAEILGVKPHTVSDYARKGLLVPFRMGERGQRAQWERTCDEMGANVSRATAWAIWNGMLRRNPMLAVFRTWNEGRGGRQADAEREDEGRAAQAEFDFGADGDGTAKGTHRASGAKTPAGAHGASAHAAARTRHGANLAAMARFRAGKVLSEKRPPTPTGRGHGRPSRPHDSENPHGQAQE